MSLTIYDISKEANVSIATVSRVLNGSDNVRESTRNKVMAVINKYDYAPNAFARGMSLKSLRTIGILCADSSDLFLAKAVYYLQQELQANDYESLLCCTGYNWDMKQNYVNLILSKKVDALILVGSNFIGTTEEENQYITDVAEQVPVMILNASLDHKNVYSTLCDDFNTMYETTMRMIHSGIQDILYIYDSESYSGKHKLQGFAAAMDESGFDNFKDYLLFYEGDSTQMDSIADAIGQFAKSGLPLDGVITSDDSLAIGAAKYAQQHGISIPDELSIIGYNNSILTTCCTPELTSVDNRLENQVHQLVQTLIAVLKGEEAPERTVFSGKLIERGTTRF